MMRILLCILFIALLVSPSFAADLESRLNSLEEALKKQQKTIEEQQQLIQQLKEELSTVKQQAPVKAEEQTVQTAKPDRRRAASTGPISFIRGVSSALI